MASKLVEKRNEFQTKQAKLAKAIEEAGTDLDFTKVKSIDGETSEERAENWKALHEECAVLGAEVTKLDLQERAEQVKRFGEMANRPTPSISIPGDGPQVKSLGQMIAAHEGYQEFKKSKGGVKDFSVNLPDIDSKALFETGAGFAPESTRTGRLAEYPTRPPQIIDFIPTIGVEQAQVVFMEETLRTHNAAERAEGGAFAEDAYEWTERTSQVRYIGTSIPVTDEQLEDEGQVAGILDNRLRFGVRQRADYQIMNGNGTPPNLRGILNVVGVQTQAKGTDPTFDAFHKAMTKVGVTGRANVNLAVFNPTNWEAIRLTRTADGIYIMGNPADPGPRSLFGVPVVSADVIAAGTALAGDFANHCAFHPRRGVTVETGYVNNQFNEGKRTLRCGMRAAFVVYRPTAFCMITGL